jgi:aldehyde:ferredoxin oxidoreductase
MPASAEPLGPDNILIFSSSIVGEMDAPALSKHTVLAKSPLTGGAGESQSASPLSPAFKRAGLDALVIHGVSQTPCYVVVKEGEITLKSAKDLWGFETAETHRAVISREGRDAHTAVIGPAGENHVRFASIVNDIDFMNCRTGMGAVMGSKKLKAIAVVPGPDLAFSNPILAREAIDDFWANRRTCLLNKVQ